MKYASFLPGFLILVIAGTLFTSCKDAGTNSSGGTDGIITGSVQLYDTLYNPMSDNSGVTVSLEGTSYHSVSDQSGKWTLANIPAGIYTLAFTKDHYLITKDQNLQFAGNGTLYYSLGGYPELIFPIANIFPNLVLRPFEDFIQITYTGDSLILDSLGNPVRAIYFYDTVTTKSDFAIFSSRSQYHYQKRPVSVVMFFAATPNIDPASPNSYLYKSGLTNAQTDSSGIASVGIHRTDLLKSGFTSGATVYCCAYAYVYINTWYDPETNKPIYSGFSPYHSEVKSFVLP